MKVNIGAGPDNWGVWFPSDPKQIPWERYLDECAEAGYEWTELGPYGYMPTDPKVLRKELDKRGIRGAEAGFVFGDMNDRDNYDNLVEETHRAAALAAELGATTHMLIDNPYTDLFTGELLREPQLTDDEWKYYIDTCHNLGTLCKEKYGLSAVIHPHAETHVQYEEEIERFLADTDPNVVNTLLDTGHHAYRHGDPVAFMRKHHKRIPYLHVKSVDAELIKRVNDENIPFAKAVAMDLFVEPSEGVVDFPGFVEVLKEINYEGFAIVEQDMYPAPFDKPLPIAKRTRQYLRDIGMG